MVDILALHGVEQSLRVVDEGAVRRAGVDFAVAAQHAGIAFLRLFGRACVAGHLAALLFAEFALLAAQFFLALLLGLDFLRGGFRGEQRGVAREQLARHQVPVIICPPVRHLSC